MIQRSIYALPSPSFRAFAASGRVPIAGSVRLAVALLLGASLLFGVTGCKKEDGKKPSEDAAAKKQPSVEDESAKKTAPAARPTKKGHMVPIGPRLVVLPGRGVSAIWFGATAETIQRHMDAKCDLLTETRCVYVKQAVDFALKDGVLDRIHIHRRDHEVPGMKGELFGSFRGILPDTIMLGLHKHVVLEEFVLKSTKVEKVEPKGPGGLVERHHYDGLILEYDEIENGNTVLGGMVVYPSKTAKELGLPVPVQK